MTASWGEVAESRRDITLYESWSTLAWGTFIPFSLPFIYSHNNYLLSARGPKLRWQELKVLTLGLNSLD